MQNEVKALVKTFRMIYNLTGFSDVRIFSLFFCNYIIMSLLVTWSSNFHILRNLPKAISLQSFSSIDCLGQVLQRDYKNTMMTSRLRHFILLGSKISIFCKTGYKLSTCQVSNQFESNFTEVFFTIFGFQNCTFCRN